MVELYKLLSTILDIPARLYLLYRIFKGKETKQSLREKLGIASIPRPEGELIWIHAASVGESLSILPLLPLLSTYNILLTTGTLTSARLIQPKLPSNVIHQFAPIDNLYIVRKFLDYWQPKRAIFVESEFWPNMILETSSRCPLISLNTRVSNNSFSKWLKYPQISSLLLNKFSLFLPQTRLDQEKLLKLGVAENKTHYIGNLKYCSPPLPVDQDKLATITKLFQGRKILAATSTHPQEEEIIINLHKTLKQKYPDVLTIIAPRHIGRMTEILKLCPDIDYSIYSNGVHDCEIFFIDKMGELGLVYSLADIAFIGGSMVPIGGHNMIEAAHFNCAIITGPQLFNFMEVVEEFTANKAMLVASDQANLLSEIDHLFAHPKQILSLAQNALNFAAGRDQKILSSIVSHIIK